ncbi:MAG TPA: sulfur carrier protein ThiS [Firmicutes bacterium]|nr:sulfur carrier protein ThiS [Bacillota bacterium]
MEIWVNDQQYQLPDHQTVAELLTHLQLEPSRVAVWVGERQLWQREYTSYRLTPGEKVRILKPVAGG